MKLNTASYTAVILVLAANSLVSAQNGTQGTGDYQKQMMNSIKQQYIQNIQGGQKQFSVSYSMETVNQGKAIFNDSSLGNNGKSCGSCHFENNKPLSSIQFDNYTAIHVQYCYDHYLSTQKIIEKEKLDKLMAFIASLRNKNASNSLNPNQTFKQPAFSTQPSGLAPATPLTPVSTPGTKTEESW